MRQLFIILTAVLTCFAGFQTANAQNSIDGQYEIAALMDSAQANFNLEEQDGVFLLDSKEVRWLNDGRMSTTIHRIIWIGTDYAVDQYGDHRIPYDGKHQRFETITVRTWRDGLWWVTGKTGIVETLPHALRNAYDYTNMREMMLLHNGIEIPCILEVAYSITDKEPYRKNIDGMWIFQKELPVVVSSISVGLPPEIEPSLYHAPELADFEASLDESENLKIYNLTSGPYDALPLPNTDELSFNASHAVWSTWESWDELGRFYDSLIAQMLELDEGLKSAIDSIENKAMTLSQYFEMVVEYVNRKTAFIPYPYEHWLQFPRAAARTYETGYGHELDRAILAKTLFDKGEPGRISSILLLGKGVPDIENKVPCIQYFAKPLVSIQAGYDAMYFDPASGSLAKSGQPYYGYSVLRLSEPETDRPGKIVNPVSSNHINLVIEMSPIESGDSLKGSAYYLTTGSLCAFNDMTGMGEEIKNYLTSFISTFLPEAELTGHNPAYFNERKCEIGFSFKMKMPEPDEFGNIRLTYNTVTGGVIDKLPDHVHVYDISRESGIYLPGYMRQTIEIRLDTSGIEMIYVPEDKEIDNAVGKFRFSTKNRNKVLSSTRMLHIGEDRIESDRWPLLRDLLLEETDQKNRVFIFKIKDDSDKKGD